MPGDGDLPHSANSGKFSIHGVKRVRCGKFSLNSASSRPWSTSGASSCGWAHFLQGALVRVVAPFECWLVQGKRRAEIRWQLLHRVRIVVCFCGGVYQVWCLCFSLAKGGDFAAEPRSASLSMVPVTWARLRTISVDDLRLSAAVLFCTRLHMADFPVMILCLF